MCAIYRGFRCVRPCTSIFHMWYIIVRFSPQNRGFGGDFAKIVWQFADTFCCRTTQKICPFKVASKTAQSVSPTACLFLNLMDVSNHMFSSHPHFILEFFHFFFEHQWTFHERHGHANRVGQLWKKNLGNQTSHCNFLGWGWVEWGFANRQRFHRPALCWETKTLFSRHSKKFISPTVSTKQPGDSTDALSNWAHSEGPAHTEGTFARTLVNVGDLRRHSGECHEGSREYGVEGSPNFAKLRQSSHEGARVLLVHHGTCLIKGKVYPENSFGATSAKTRWRKTAWRVDALPPYPPKNRAPQVNSWPISVFLFESSPPKQALFSQSFSKNWGELCQIRSGEPSWTICALSL